LLPNIFSLIIYNHLQLKLIKIMKHSQLLLLKLA